MASNQVEKRDNNKNEKSTLEEDTEIYYSIIIENDASNTNVACDALIRTVCINGIDQVP